MPGCQDTDWNRSWHHGQLWSPWRMRTINKFLHCSKRYPVVVLGAAGGDCLEPGLLEGLRVGRDRVAGIADVKHSQPIASAWGVGVGLWKWERICGSGSGFVGVGVGLWE